MYPCALLSGQRQTCACTPVIRGSLWQCGNSEKSQPLWKWEHLSEEKVELLASLAFLGPSFCASVRTFYPVKWMLKMWARLIVRKFQVINRLPFLFRNRLPYGSHGQFYICCTRLRADFFLWNKVLVAVPDIDICCKTIWFWYMNEPSE